jgi:MYXO-CTERM domain-containing protein
MAERETDGPTEGTVQRTPLTPEQIEAEIERTRDELGETVAALAEKTDVKKHAREKVDEAKARADQTAAAAAEAAQRNPAPVIAAAVAVALVGIVLVRRRRR